MIPINKPFLPPKAEYDKYISSIWQSSWLTNNGPLLRELENQLRDRISHDHLHYVSNGTVALQLAIKALGISGEVITTPFSFVATTSSLVWEKCTPVYCDIDQETLNIDTDKIEVLITNNTKCILATHVYGNPCEVKKIERLASKYGLSVIYDAAHAFDVEVEGEPVLKYGDVSTCSLHATKYYHSIEGGLVVSDSARVHTEVGHMRSFGFNSNYDFHGLGINGKNSEFHAAMGLANLEHLVAIKAKRRQLSEVYDSLLKNLPLRQPTWKERSSKNYAYYPIIFEDEEILLRTMAFLEAEQVYTRRYFYPALNRALPYVEMKNPTPVCDSISKRVLCLPLYYDLTLEDVEKVCKIIKDAMVSQYV